MSAVSSIPLVKLLGITPNGLNATSDGEIRVFYDYHALQQSVFKDNLKRVMDIIQLSEFGDIDDGITFDFEPLYEMSAKERAEIRKVDADTDAVYVPPACSLATKSVKKSPVTRTRPITLWT
jgi:hypothetical protein